MCPVTYLQDTQPQFRPQSRVKASLPPRRLTAEEEAPEITRRKQRNYHDACNEIEQVQRSSKPACGGGACGRGRLDRVSKSTPGNQPQMLPLTGCVVGRGQDSKDSCQHRTQPGRCGSQAYGMAYVQGCAAIPTNTSCAMKGQLDTSKRSKSK